jgi:hypothetical protein
MAVEWKDVSSSNVSRVGWNDETNELLVEFASGSVYAYPDAGESAYQDLLVSTSPGGYVSRNLRRLPARKVS